MGEVYKVNQNFYISQPEFYEVAFGAFPYLSNPNISKLRLGATWSDLTIKWDPTWHLTKGKHLHNSKGVKGL